jgi:hypothetical protein
MQAEQKAFVTAGFASGAAVVLVLLAFVLGWETISLRTRLAEAHQTGRESTSELSRLQAQHANAESNLAEHREQLEALRAELKSWRDNAANPPAAAGTGARVRVYSGGRYLGMGWIQPGQTQSGEGAAVILDTAPQAAPAAAPAVGQAAAASSSYSFVQQYPSWPYLWTVGWIGCEPTNNQPTPPAGGVTPEKPVPPSPPVHPVPASVVASVARTAMPARFNSFPPFGLQTVPRAMAPVIGQRLQGFGQMASAPAVTRSSGAAPSAAANTRVGALRPASAGMRR